MGGRLGRRAPVGLHAGVLGATLAAVLSVAVLPATAAVENLADASADKVLASAVVPDTTRKVGEVHLLSRGDAVVVQTLLSTKLLSRVIAEIRKKEEGNWPPGEEATHSYMAALEAARETVEKRDGGLDWRDRRHRLLIEFAADAADAVVLVGTFQFADDGENPAASGREVFATLALPRAYILRNMRLILADSFKVAEPDVDRLGPLGPAAASALQRSVTPSPPSPPAPGAAAAPAPKGAAPSAAKGVAPPAPSGAAK